MPLVQWGEYKPDVADYLGSASRSILNGIPQGDGYGPFQDFTVFSGAMAAACRGAFYALDTDGSVATFAGTSTKLYKLNNTTLAWGDVSKSSGTYTTLDATAQWRFVQFNSLVIAVQANAPPQVFTLGSSSEFADLGGSPPQAAYADVVGQFVVLSGLASNKTRVRWSAIGDPTGWTAGTNQSSYQDLPDGGIVRGVAGGEFGTIFQDQAIRRMSYVPGSPLIFQIERISQDHGLYAPYSLIRAGDKIFFHSAKGFHRIDPGGYPVQIGRERVDRTFFADLDKGNLQLFQGAADPRSSRVFFSYKSNSGSTGLYDKILGYDYALDRWFALMASGEYLLGMSQTGLTLESLDALSSSIDAMTSSFDDYATSVTPEIAQFNSAHKLGFFRGSNLEATFETAEQGLDGRRMTVRGFMPVTDAASLYGSLRYRDTQGASSTDGDEIALNTTTGKVDRLKSTRFARFKVRIPAATEWTFCAGVEPDLTREGAR